MAGDINLALSALKFSSSVVWKKTIVNYTKLISLTILLIHSLGVEEDHFEMKLFIKKVRCRVPIKFFL